MIIIILFTGYTYYIFEIMLKLLFQCHEFMKVLGGTSRFCLKLQLLLGSLMC